MDWLELNRKNIQDTIADLNIKGGFELIALEAAGLRAITNFIISLEQLPDLANATVQQYDEWIAAKQEATANARQDGETDMQFEMRMRRGLNPNDD